MGIKRGEKVDYAILQDGKPVMIIEAKSINRNLEKHDSQLFRYFSTTEAKFAILTNGIRYRFYTDLDNQNKMDAIPFLDFDLLHLRDTQIEDLQKFHKDNFNVAEIAESASDMKYKDSFKQLLGAQWECPSDDFVRFVLKDVYHGTKTQFGICDCASWYTASRIGCCKSAIASDTCMPSFSQIHSYSA